MGETNKEKTLAAKAALETNKEKLIAVMNSLKTDPQASELFNADPQAYLKSKGLETGHLSFSTAQNTMLLDNEAVEVSDADLAMIAGGGCVGAGYYACYTEGD
jgi:hypothetical protein